MSLPTRLALARPLTTWVLMVLVVAAGWTAWRDLPRESFPEIRIPLVLVRTTWAGASPADMESQVTREIEQELKGLAGLKEIRSTSTDGFSLIEVEFTPDVDLDTALMRVRERVDLAKPDLPDDADDPVIEDVDFSRIPIMLIELGGRVDEDRLRELAEALRDELETIPGVNVVHLLGARDRVVRVEADPRRMAARGIGFRDLVTAIEREQVTIPGGHLDIGDLRFLVRLPAEVDDPGDVADFVVARRGGTLVRVRDVAEVVYGHEEATTLSRLDRAPSITLSVEKRTGANILEVAAAVRARVDGLRRRLPPGAMAKVTADQSEDIEEMVRNLEDNIVSGLLLVLVVLFLAMGWRPAVIVSLAIPFSMLVTFVAVALLGYTLNMVVLFSLVLVLGMLVDNAIVTVENTWRHRELGEDSRHAALVGTSEVAAPIVASTLTTLCAFAPMLFWPGIIGEFMKFLPATLILGLTASLFVALVFNPALAASLFRDPPRRRVTTADDPGPFRRRYRALLAWCLDAGPQVPFRFARNWLLLAVFFGCTGLAALLGMGALLLGTPAPGRAIGILAAVGGAAFALHGLAWLASLPLALAGRQTMVTDHRARVLWTMGAILAATAIAYGAFGEGVEFFPEIEPRTILVDLAFPPGTNLSAQDRLVRQVEERLADTPDLVDMVANVGSTGVSTGDPVAPGGTGTRSRVTLHLRKFHERTRNSFLTLDEVRRKVADLAGARITVDKPQEGPPTGKPVTIRLLGDDWDELGAAAEELHRRLARVPGLVNVDDDHDEGSPEVRILVDRDAVARAGLSTAAVGDAVRTALAGTDAAEYRAGEDEWDITVRLAPGDRRSLGPLSELTLATPGGRAVPLRALARIVRETGPTAIRRVDLHRAITVSADVDHAAGYRDPDMRRTAAGILREMRLPPGIRWEFAGSNEEETESRRFLSRAFVVALLLIALVLVTEFDSLVTPLTILVSVALSLIGVLWGLLVTRMPFGIIMTGIGVISLAGIVVNNAIVLCDFILQERARGVPRREAVIRAGLVRLRPVLLTAITTILGLVPLTLGISLDVRTGRLLWGGESSQWWGPMGVAVIFGLAVATVLTLVVVPVTWDVLAGAAEAVSRRGAPGRHPAGERA